MKDITEGAEYAWKDYNNFLTFVYGKVGVLSYKGKAKGLTKYLDDTIDIFNNYKGEKEDGDTNGDNRDNDTRD